MQFELNIEFISVLRENIKNKDDEAIRKQLSSLYHADIADIMDELSFEDAKYVYFLLDDETAVQLFVDLEDDIRINLLRSLQPDVIAKKIIEHLDSDDAADVINDIPNNLKDEVFKFIKDKKHAQDILSLVHYDEDTAGGLMTKELVIANINWSISQCIEEIRKQSENVGKFYNVYVVDNNGVYLGKLSLERLVISSLETKVIDIYNKEAISITTHTSSEEVAIIMSKYDIVALPVVDALGKLVGRITIDDVVDVIKEEAEKDIQMLSGITENVDTGDKVWILSRARLPWLLVGLLGGIVSSRVIGVYEHQLRINPEIALFIPLIAAMGGNAGVQSSTIVVQGLANNTLAISSVSRKLFKEFKVSLINGLVCGVIIFMYNILLEDSNNLCVTVSSALLAVIIFASIFGTFIPLVLNKFKIDPALATGPFVTTMIDILGLTLYFFIGRLFYNF